MTNVWLSRLQRSALRLNSGGSGAFVSATGLVITNHHVVLGVLGKAMGAGKDIDREEFVARCLSDERPCPGLELKILVSTKDVTAALEAPANLATDEVPAFRRIKKAAIEQEEKLKTGLLCEVAEQYQGNQYVLNCYKRYTDVRLVYAPEGWAAYFGGEADNFDFPRFAFDVCFLRAYENGKPAVTPDYLKWSKKGAKESEMVFTLGSPGRTNRFLLSCEIEHERDERILPTYEWAKRYESILLAYADHNAEKERQVAPMLFTARNTRKRYEIEYASLNHPGWVVAKKAEEAELQRFAAGKLGERDIGEAFDCIEKSEAALGPAYRHKVWLGQLAEKSSSLLALSRMLFRHQEEKRKLDAEGFRVPQESNQLAHERALFFSEIIDEGLERVRLATYIELLVEKLGPNDPVVAALIGKAPLAQAAEWIEKTKVKSIDERKRLYDLPVSQFQREVAVDPLLAFVASLEPAHRRAMARFQKADESKLPARRTLADARRLVPGETVYPDGNSILRLGSGSVCGFEKEGSPIPTFTRFAQMIERAQATAASQASPLPQRWLNAPMNLETPLNFTCSCDVIGGSSGSAVVNRKGELVGLVFDGNRYAAASEFAYNPKSRAIALDVRAITEVLKHVHHATNLIEELEGGSVSSADP